jgi:hypothetical protein
MSVMSASSIMGVGNNLIEGVNALVSIDMQNLNSAESNSAVASFTQIAAAIVGFFNSESFRKVVGATSVGFLAANAGLVLAVDKFESALNFYNDNPNDATQKALLEASAGLFAAAGGVLAVVPIPQIRVVGLIVQLTALGVQNAVNGNFDKLGEKLGSEITDLLHSMDKAKRKFNDAKNTISPIALDLNGDGIQTTGVEDGAYFDHDKNGFAEQTGWVSPEDGLLVRDLDGNGQIDSGRELFGNQTSLANGYTAANGYQALAELDSNHDGQIDAADSAYVTLQIWQDSNGDGYSSANELHTLAEVGVQSVSTAYTADTLTDVQGNAHRQAGTYTTTIGETRAAEDIWFQVDNTYTLATEWLDVPADIAALPDLAGYGNVYDLHQAMVRDTTGELKGLVEQFETETTQVERLAA